MGEDWVVTVVVATAAAVRVAELTAGAETAVARAAAKEAEGTVAGSVEVEVARRGAATTAAAAAAATREDTAGEGLGRAAVAARAGVMVGVLWVAGMPRRKIGRSGGGRRQTPRPCNQAWGRRSCRR